MANKEVGGIGRISGKGKGEEEDSRHAEEVRRYGKETGGTRWKRGTPV